METLKCKNCNSNKLKEIKVDSVIEDYLDPLTETIQRTADATYVDYECCECKEITTVVF